MTVWIDALRQAPAETRLFAGLAVLAITIGVVMPLEFSGSWLVAVIVVPVVLLGLPHGAIDPFIAWQSGVWRSPAGAILFLAVYTLLAGLVFLAWNYAPIVLLTGFLLISAWHFAGDWRLNSHWAARLAIGVSLLSLPALFHEYRVAELYTYISGDSAELVASLQGAIAPAGLCVLMAGALLADPVERVELILLAALAITVPPLLYFAIYFCVLHSPRHIRNTLQDLSPLARRQAVLASAVFTAATLLLAIPAWLWLSDRPVFDSRLIAIVFIGLAALTVPHMLLIEWRERRS